MTPRYFDAHCHVHFEDYAHDGDAIIEQMKEEGVAGITVGVDLASSRRALAVAEAHDHIFAAVGLHPNRAGSESFDTPAFRAIAANPKCVGIGECGLDYYRPAELTDEVKRVQKETLHAHIELAAELDKPLIIHSRPSKGTQDAYRDLIGILKEAKREHPKLRGDIHFFVGGIEEMREFVALGFTVSYTAIITFARDYDAVIRDTPLASILSETDAPYAAPASRRRERNDPLAVRDVVRQIAEIRGEAEEGVRAALFGNALALFKPPGLSAV